MCQAMTKMGKSQKTGLYQAVLPVLTAALLVGYWCWRYWEGNFDLRLSLEGNNEYFCVLGNVPALDIFLPVYMMMTVVLMVLEWLVVADLVSRRQHISSPMALYQSGRTFLPFLVLVYFPIILALGFTPTLVSLFLFILSSSCFLGLQVMLLRPNLESLGRWAPVMLAAVILIMVMVLTWMNLAAYRNLRLGYTDSGIFSEILWNTLKGRPFHSNSLDPTNSPTGSYLGLHFSPILLLLLPIYALFPCHETLLILQPILLGLAAVPVYLLTRRITHSTVLALALATAYLTSPALSHVNWGNSYGFHLFCLFPLLIVCQFYFLETGRWWWFGASVLLAMMCKEIGALITIMMGIFIVLRYRRWKLGAATSLGGLVWFLAAIYILVPGFGGGGKVISRYHSQLGSNLFEVGLKLVPAVGAALLDYKRIVFLLHILVPTALISVLSPVTLLAGGLAFLGIILADDVSKYSVVLGHQAVLIPVVLAASAYGIRKVSESPRLSSWLSFGLYRKGVTDVISFLVVLVLTSALLSSHFFGILPWSRGFPQDTFTITPRSRTVDRIKQMIPREDSVASTPRLAAHFTTQKDLYFFPWNRAPENYRSADWVIIDLNDDWASQDELQAIVRKLRAAPDYEPDGRFRQQNFLIFRKQSSTASKA